MQNNSDGGAASCTHSSCPKRATYGVEASRRRQCCAEHARPWMVNIDHTRCATENCDTRATFGDPATGRREFCSKHAPSGMHNVERKKCVRQGCPLPPAYGDPTNRKRRCCVEHAEEGMVKLDKKLCPFKGCFTSASYGVLGEKRKFCAAHAQRGMVSIGGRRCAKEECTKRANYGVAGTNKREFCAGHASPDMVNINNQAGGRRVVSCGRGGGGSSGKRSAAEPRSAAKQRQLRPKPPLPAAAAAAAASSGYDGAAAEGREGLLRREGTRTGSMALVAGGAPPLPRCVVHNCAEPPTYRFPGETNIRFCAAHAVGGTVAAQPGPQQQRQSRHPPRVYTHELLVARAPLKKRPRDVCGPVLADANDTGGYRRPGMAAPPSMLPAAGAGQQKEPGARDWRLPQHAGGSGGGGATSGTGGGSGARPGGLQQAPSLRMPSAGSRADEAQEEELQEGGAALFALQKTRLVMPWPTTENPPLLQTEKWWKAWEWRPLALHDARP